MANDRNGQAIAPGQAYLLVGKALQELGDGRVQMVVGNQVVAVAVAEIARVTSVAMGADAAAQRTAMGLGSAATRNVGFGAADLVDLGTLVTAFQPLDSDLSTIAAMAPADGTILVRSGGAWVALAPGTEGQALRINSSGVPEWQDL